MKTSVDFLKTGYNQSNVFSYLILDKCERRLKKMIEDSKTQKYETDFITLLTQ